MTYETFQNEFITDLKVRLKEVLTEDFALTIVHPECHSKPPYTGLQFALKGMSLCPVVNLDEFYNMYRGGESMDAMLETAVRLFSCDYGPAQSQYSRIGEYEYSKPYIIYKLINRERNKELLKRIPHIDLLDMAIVFQLMMCDAISGGYATHLIHNDLAEMWGVDSPALLMQASENTPRILNPHIKTLSDTMADILKRNGPQEDLCDLLTDAGYPPVIVITNSRFTQGAATILYSGMLKGLSDIFHDDFYLIPSSVHEMIALPAASSPQDCEALTDMLREVNRTEVAEEDFLSDHVYYYSRSENQLSYCCN